MKLNRNMIVAGAMALMMPIAAGTASAAAVDATPLAPMSKSLNGHAVIADTGLAERRAAFEASKIREAGRRGRRGRSVRGLAAGIIAGAAAAAILSGAARAHDRPYRSRAGHYNRCDRWYFRCEDGVRRACRKYYNYCD